MVLLVREHERGFDHVSEFLLHDRNAFDDIRLWVGNHGEDDVLQHAVLDGVELVHVLDEREGVTDPAELCESRGKFDSELDERVLVAGEHGFVFGCIESL